MRNAKVKGDKVGVGSPLLPPALAEPSSLGLLQSCSLCRQRRESGCWWLGGQKLLQSPH